MEQLVFISLALAAVLEFLSTGDQLIGAIQELRLPIDHLYGGNGVISGDYLDRLATTDWLHGCPGLEFETVGAALTHRC